MVKNWSKIVLVSMLVVIFATSLAYASTSRVRSLANAGNYMTDDSDVFRWYSTLPSYANMVQAEMGTWSGMGEFDGLVDTRALGFNYACGDDGKWGTYRITLLENATDHGSFWINNPVLGMLTPGMFADGIFPGVPSDNNIHPFDQTPINTRDIAGGWDVNENIAIGVAINMSGWAYENKTRAHTFKADIGNYTFGVGGTWSNNEGTVVDAAFTYGMATGKLEGIAGDPDSTLEWDSKSAMDISARMFWDWKDFVTVVPVIEYAKATYSVKPSSEPNGDDVSVIMFGAGLNMDVNDDNMLIFALEVMLGKWSYANPDTAGGSIDEIALVSVPTINLSSTILIVTVSIKLSLPYSLVQYS